MTTTDRTGTLDGESMGLAPILKKFTGKHFTGMARGIVKPKKLCELRVSSVISFGLALPLGDLRVG